MGIPNISAWKREMAQTTFSHIVAIAQHRLWSRYTVIQLPIITAMCTYTLYTIVLDQLTLSVMAEVKVT